MNRVAYPHYKWSGVEWLGDVPQHWTTKRLKYSATINDEALPEPTAPEFEFTYVDIGSVSAIEGITATEQLTFDRAPSRARRIVRAGDTIVSTVRTYLRAIAPILQPPPRLIVSTGFAVIRPRRVHPHFLSYALRESSFVETVVARSVGVSYPAINASEIGAIPIPLPHLEEQRAIADFLDRETARLDRLVGKKRELIEKLKEKRTALISRTVTRGLPAEVARKADNDPQITQISADGREGKASGNLRPSAKSADNLPKLKPSGIEWLGDIPEHWKLKSFRRMIRRLDQGWSPNANNYPADEGELGVLKLSVASKGRFRPQENKALDQIPAGAVAITPAAGDLLISRSNTPDLVGDACVVHADYPNLIIPDLLYRLKIKTAEASSAFLCWFLLSTSGRAQIERDARGSSGSMVKLGQGHLRAWLVPAPPVDEQRAIADYLDRETAKLDRLMEKVEAAIGNLQEYRSALITAAVTGTIDVQKK